MSTNTAPIKNPAISILPSKKLRDYIKTIKISKSVPVGISNMILKHPISKSDFKPKALDFLTTPEDKEFIKSISESSKKDYFTKLPFNTTITKKKDKEGAEDKLLDLQDLNWLHDYIQEQNKQNKNKVYLHVLMEGSDVILPKNQEIPRNSELDLRCRKLKAEQENQSYMKMTKNVDSARRKLPEDTIGYQLKQLNKHIVAIFQFIVSVAAGFAFGFIGVELMIGNLDFGFKLLLGIICALTIALAELYFLAKKLNEDLQFEYLVEKQQKSVKVE